MLDLLRTSLHRAITSPRGDRFTLVRVPKDAIRRVNTMLGLPICSREELEKRRAAHAKLEELRRTGETKPREKLEAPVVVYFEKDRNTRELVRIEELLAAKKIAFRKLDVAGDEAAVSFVLRDSKKERDQLPVVFVGATAIGTYNDLVKADVSGELQKLL